MNQPTRVLLTAVIGVSVFTLYLAPQGAFAEETTTAPGGDQIPQGNQTVASAPVELQVAMVDFEPPIEPPGYTWKAATSCWERETPVTLNGSPTGAVTIVRLFMFMNDKETETRYADGSRHIVVDRLATKGIRNYNAAGVLINPNGVTPRIPPRKGVKPLVQGPLPTAPADDEDVLPLGNLGPLPPGTGAAMGNIGIMEKPDPAKVGGTVMKDQPK